MNLLRGHFVILVRDYRDAQYGKTGFPLEWCVSVKKYYSSTNIEKIRKFDHFNDAQEYIDHINSRYIRKTEFIKLLT